MWELGLHGGSFLIIGDVAPRPGFGFGFHVRRALDYPISLRLDASYNQGYGLEPRNTGGVTGPSAVAQSLEKIYNFSSTGAAYHHNFRTRYIAASIQGVYSLNNFNYKKQLSKRNYYVYGGFGFNSFVIKTNALNGSTPYNWPTGTVTQKDLKAIMDKTYETEIDPYSPHDIKVTVGGDDLRTLQFHGQVGAGVSFKLTKKINLGIDHQVSLVFGNNGDMLDGYRLKTTTGIETQYRDLINYTSLRLNFNLGNSNERTEPLYWTSPLENLNDDVAELKARPKFDPTDTDTDGVIDMFDQEKESPAGAAVDTRGVTLDSDKDGLPDYKDKEPYSPPGYKIDNQGVAQVPKQCCITEPDVVKIVDSKVAAMKNELTSECSGSDWFLPMVQFDNGKSSIKNNQYDKLHHIASVMKNCPNLRIVATGFTDGPSNNRYNSNLSCARAQSTIDFLVNKYGISRDRFVLNFGGEENPLFNSKGSQLINRRVEFTVAKGETDMSCPSGVNSSSRKKSGNKEAGF